VFTFGGGLSVCWGLVFCWFGRFFCVLLDGKLLKVIGNDGGLLQSPYEVDEILLTPGERIDIAAGPFTQGDHFSMDALPYDRMTFLKAKKRQYAIVKVLEWKQSIASVPERLRNIDPLTTASAPAMRKVKLSVGPSVKTGLSFKMNGGVHVQDEPVYLGELQVWEVDNASLMDHPFHLHGFFFQVLEENGKANTNISWKDTYNLKPRTKIKIAWMPDRPGKWMYHCHIVEHHAAGMMANFEVIERGSTYTPSAHVHNCT
jgi:FtsP/CotA-like multicopper oxidase with cupredoxin domain